MIHPTGKSLFVDSRGRLWIVSRERDHDSTVGYALLRVTTETVNGFRHKYQAVSAAELEESPRRDDLAEQGRQLASEREDLIAAGADPAELAVPLHPGGGRSALEQAQLDYVSAEGALLIAVNNACPGQHQPIQHRDQLPPWCHACGRTRLGDPVRTAPFDPGGAR